MSHPPLEIAFWVGDYLRQHSNRNRLNNYQLMTMQKLINSMVGNLEACERIFLPPYLPPILFT